VSRSTAISRFGRPTPHAWPEEVEWAPLGRESIERGDGFLIYLADVPADEAQLLASAIYHVRRDGTLALPHVGRLIVAGLTVEQAAAIVQQAYVDRKIYRHPTIALRRAPNPDRWHLFPRLDVPGPGYRLKGNSLLINRLQG
jgi:protein involved in polysaccharide export with SLBB domain